MARFLALIPVCASIVVCASSARAQETPGVTVAPIVRLAGRDVIACGVRLDVSGAAAAYVEVILTDDREGRAFHLTARGAQGRALTAVELATADSSTTTLFGPLRPAPDGTLTARAALPGLPGSEFMRGLMVGGGVLTLTFTDGARASVAVPGPFSQQVRGSYINCAGDLKTAP